MAKNVVENFHAYCKVIEEDTAGGSSADLLTEHFQTYSELKTDYNKKGD